jgi:hypothetical protein
VGKLRAALRQPGGPHQELARALAAAEKEAAALRADLEREREKADARDKELKLLRIELDMVRNDLIIQSLITQYLPLDISHTLLIIEQVRHEAERSYYSITYYSILTTGH